uniref:Uncharacterized protein n=1 Tax=Arundo donax TaxID=35708 RepID=A0A0A9CCA5_ARUDO
MRLPISLGMLPETSLTETERNISELERLESESGRNPPNLLAPKSNICNWEQFVNADMNSQSFGSLA